MFFIMYLCLKWSCVSFFRYTWKKDNVLITMNEHITLLGGDLTILNPSGNDAGMYQCFATNDFGTAASTRTKVKKVCKWGQSLPTIINNNKIPTRQWYSFHFNTHRTCLFARGSVVLAFCRSLTSCFLLTYSME